MDKYAYFCYSCNKYFKDEWDDERGFYKCSKCKSLGIITVSNDDKGLIICEQDETLLLAVGKADINSQLRTIKKLIKMV